VSQFLLVLQIQLVKIKIFLLSDDLLQMVHDTIFDNQFTNIYRFNYSRPNNNENNDMLDSNVMVNDDDVDDEMIPSILEFKDVF
jgi:hypothetical protein